MVRDGVYSQRESATIRIEVRQSGTESDSQRQIKTVISKARHSRRNPDSQKESQAFKEKVRQLEIKSDR